MVPHRELWQTPDIPRTQQILEELHIDLVYTGQLEALPSPGWVGEFEEMAAQGLLEAAFPKRTGRACTPVQDGFSLAQTGLLTHGTTVRRKMRRAAVGIGQFLVFYLVIQIVAVAALPVGGSLFCPSPATAATRLPACWEFCSPVICLRSATASVCGATKSRWRLAGLAPGCAAQCGWQRGLQPRNCCLSWRSRLLSLKPFLGSLFLPGRGCGRTDPAADHTEQPMDLMFMNSIRASLTYPPPGRLARRASDQLLLLWVLVDEFGRIDGRADNVCHLQFGAGSLVWALAERLV
jgi:hypothetical protein